MTQQELTAYIQANYAGTLTLLDTGRAEPMFELRAEDLIATATKLRDDPQLQFNYLCNMGGVDTGLRLEVVYQIASTTNRLRMDFKLVLGYENPEVDTLTVVWPAACWYEREMWELYGITPKNHPDLRILLLPDDWNQGNPMRKNWTAPDFIKMPEL
jgi:NADH:ubiquinone oxidoreductase subunit C